MKKLNSSERDKRRGTTKSLLQTKNELFAR